MRLTTLKQLKNVRGKRVLLRLDLNVPLHNGKIATGGDERIKAAVPTLIHLLDAGARVVVVSHLGRPRGRDESLSLAPVAKRLAALLDRKVTLVADALDDDAKVDAKIAKLKEGEALMLENIRFYKGEEGDGRFLSRRLASLADVFVNDAFGVLHRSGASVSGVAVLLPSYAGLIVEKEVANLSRVLEKPKKPFVVMLGGAKVSEKIKTIERMVKIADKVLIGGAMANAFIKAAGHSIGRSEASPTDVRLARALSRRRNIVLPTDVLVAKRLDDHANPQVRPLDQVRKDEYVVDAGTETVRTWARHIKSAKTLVWNGPLGLFEVRKFSHGSVALGRVIAARSSGKAFGVVGGGETVQCLNLTGMAEFVDHVSTGGGAMLAFLAGEELPGLLPLENRGRITKKKKR